jgi:hypothetical protein
VSIARLPIAGRDRTTGELTSNEVFLWIESVSLSSPGRTVNEDVRDRIWSSLLASTQQPNYFHMSFAPKSIPAIDFKTRFVLLVSVEP